MTKSSQLLPATLRVVSLQRTVLLTNLFALSLLTLMPAQAQTFNVLHNFSGGGDGATPYAGVTMDRAGNLYGTTFGGGSRSLGAVYRLKRSGQSWTVDGLYGFNGGPYDGLHPLARVVFGPDGSLYGTASEGGPGQFCGVGCGMVFQLRPPLTVCRSVSCPWTESVLYFFAGVPDGGFPSGELVFDQAGNLYGTTDIGGNFGGILYELTRSGSAWTENIIHEFSGSDGYFPFGGLISDNAGNLYGAAQEGGLFGQGAIFQFTRSESGWTQSLPYIFHGGTDGRSPNASLIFDHAGNLYGTSSDGASGGGGTVFELSPAGGGGWTYSLLYSFIGSRTLSCPNPGNQSGGPGPWAPLIMDGAGNLYGTTLCDGAHQFGNIFKLTPTGGGWSYTSLHDFTGGEDGAYPLSSVTMDASNNLYGTASGGGSQGHGVVWEITP